MHEANEQRPRWAFGLALVALLVVIAVAVLPLWADARSRSRTPEDAEVALAVAAIRGAFEDGDAVWVEPSWWVVPRHGLERMGAGTERWPFPALMVTEDADPVELHGYRRLFVLAGFQREPRPPPELAMLDLPGEVIFQGEDVAVARWDLGESPRLRTLTREWKKLEVSRRFSSGEAPTPCRLRRDKHRCGRDSWMDVALEPRVVWRRETDWLFVHPGPAGSTLDVSWDGLARTHAGQPTWLYLRVGQTLEAVRHPEGKPVLVQVLIDEREVDAVALDPHRFWMERRAIRLPAGEGDARVTIRISTEDPAWRETVLEADLLSALPASLAAWATAVIE